MTGIKDIAAACGVSIATVSNVLNNKKNVGKDTREKILRTAKELGYVHKASSMQRNPKSKNTVVVNFSDFDTIFYLDILHGISDYAVRRDYNLLICTKENLAKYADPDNVCGVIVIDSNTDDGTIISIADAGIPIITLDRQLSHRLIKNMVVSNYESERQLIEKLVEAGYRSYAFLKGLDTEDCRERYRAFRDVLKEHDIPFHRNDLYEGDWRERSGGAAARLILLQERLPEVLVCANDMMAIGVIRKLQENSIKVPDDISVCGFDDILIAKYLGLTTVSVPDYERGFLSMQALSEILDGSGTFETFKIGARLKWRRSTKNFT